MFGCENPYATPTAPSLSSPGMPVALRFGQAQAVIQGLEALQCPAVLVGQALANFEPTEWTKKNILQVNSVPWRIGIFTGG